MPNQPQIMKIELLDKENSLVESREVPYQIFCDGACQGNPGPGGYGAIIICNGTRKEINGGEKHTTNNQMEMTAAIRALETLEPGSVVTVTTDSQYLKNGITRWIHGWKKNGWQTADKKPVKNKDLWLRLDDLNRRHRITWEWIKGHVGHPENEQCDELARMAIDEKLALRYGLERS